MHLEEIIDCITISLLLKVVITDNIIKSSD